MKYNLLSQLKANSLGFGKHNDGRGLYLVKKRKETGKWVLRLSINKKRREMGLGRWPDVPIAEARELADDARRQLRNGNDPIALRQQAQNARQSMSLQEAIEGCFKARQAKLKDGGKAGRWLSALNNHVIPKIGSMAVEQIDQHVLKSALEPIWNSKPTTAAKALNRTGLSIQYAAALGLEVDMQAVDKAKALLGTQRVKVKHIPSMPYQEVPKFYRSLTDKSSVGALALRLLILTIARTSEIRLATFDEFEGDTWLLAGERTKSGREHRIPLTKEAISIVETVRSFESNQYLFSPLGDKPMSDMAMSKFMKSNGYDYRPHGFRSSFRVWAEEQTDADYAVKEACLAHHVDSGVVGAYQRSDRLEKRRDLLNIWSGFVLSA